MPVCPREATEEQLGGFSRSLVFWHSVNTCRNIRASHTMISGDLHDNLHAFLNQSLTQLAKCLSNREILLFFICFFFRYSSLFLALVSLTTHVHSLSSKALVFHFFTRIFLKSNSTSSIQINLGFPF